MPSRRTCLAASLALLPGLMALSTASHAAQPAPDSMISTYEVHLPSTPDSHPPLLVLMHGFGANENDLIGLAKYLPPNLLVVTPQAPIANGNGGGYRWYTNEPFKGQQDGNAREIEASATAVRGLIEQMIKRYDADPHRVFIGGFSQGAVMTYELALRYPGMFRGAVVMSGAIYPSLLAELEAAPPPTDQPVPPFFVGHGTADERVPYAEAEAARSYLTRRNIPLSFHSYAGMHHQVNEQEIADLSAWLTTQLSR